MKFRIDTRGFTEPLRQAAQREARNRSNIVKAVRRGAVKVQGNAVRLVQNSPPVGETYGPNRGAGLSEYHTASAPGFPPRSDTGNLAQRIHVVPEPDGAAVIAATDYAVHLEYGTRNMAPRPFMSLALKNKEQEIEDELRDELRRFWEL